MPPEAQEDVKFLYVNWVRIDEIAEKFKLTPALLRRHAAQVGWYDERLANTKAKFAAIADSEVNFKGSDAVKALENLDKKAGDSGDIQSELMKKLDALTSLELNRALKELQKDS
jgi:hypothetical protein